MHAVHIEYQLSQCLQNVLLVGLITELTHLREGGRGGGEGEGEGREGEGGGSSHTH